MSKRFVLEDSESDDDGKPPAKNDFFTTEEKEAIEKCDIQINNNGGKYSEDLMSRAIARVGEPPLEAVKQGGGESSYERYCVKKGKVEAQFFDRDIYKAHDPKGDGYSSSSPSEETILLEIEVIRRSEKSTKNKLFKLKETGGMVVFGPWWNYAMQRVLELSSDKTVTAENFGQYTAVKIIRSMFSLITKDSKEIVKPGNLSLLSSRMGVDWVENIKTARRVIDQCGPNHFLDKELSVVEVYVESLVKKKVKADAKPAAATATGTSSKAKSSADIDKKRSEAGKARLAAMKANSRRKPPSMIGSGANGIPSPKKAAASTSLGGREPFARGGDALRSAEPRSRNNEAPRQNDGFPPQPSSQGKTSNKTDDGWGRDRDGDSSPQPVKTEGSWKFARRTLGSYIPEAGRNDRPAPQEVDSRGGAPERPPAAAARDNSSSRDDHNRDQGHGGQYESRGSGSRYESRSGSSPSRYGDSRSSARYDDRQSDRRGDYSRSHSRGEDNGRGTSGGDEYRPSRSRDGSSRYDEGSKRSRSQDRDDRDNRSQKRFRPPNETRAPTASAAAPAHGAGRGRGAHVNKPAWMTQQEQGNGPTGMPRSDNGSATTGPAAAGTSSNYPTAASGAPASSSVVAPSGAGRGRGANKNLPAWMTQQGQGSIHNGPAGMPSNNTVSTNPGAGVTGMNANHPTPSLNVSTAASSGAGSGRGASNVPARMTSSSVAAPPMGRGRGRGTDNRPAWMARQDSAPINVPAQQAAPINVPAGMQQQAPAPSANLNAQAPNPSHSVGGLTSNGGGRGRGRGRGKNLPAWMTNPPKP